MLWRMRRSLNLSVVVFYAPHPLPYAPLTLDDVKFPINPCIVHILTLPMPVSFAFPPQVFTFAVHNARWSFPSHLSTHCFGLSRTGVTP